MDYDEEAEGVVEANPEAVEDARDGEEGALNYLVGQFMQRTGGRADPGKSRKALDRAISEEEE